jgi:hypothetical protein
MVARSDRITEPDICSRSAYRESCGFARQAACYRSPAAWRGAFAASANPVSRSVPTVAENRKNCALETLRCLLWERGGCRAAEQRDELAPLHSMTSSASASSIGGISRPSALAALRLITISNLVGCSTGRSAGLVPFKILITYVAARRYKSRWLTP